MNPLLSPHRARVVLADDHTLVAEACKKLLEPEFEVVRIVPDGRALLAAAAELKPDVIVSDIAMPQLNGLDAGEQLRQLLPPVRLIFLTMNASRDLAAEAFRRGASGYLLKTSAASELIIAIRQALRGERYVSPLISKLDVRRFLAQRTEAQGDALALTPRQREVLQLLAEGRSMKEVGNVLNLATRTVAFHKYRIMSMLGLKSNAELVQYAIRNSIISA
jgi:DNA-binding NarL/FixJ family response regulator